MFQRGGEPVRGTLSSFICLYTDTVSPLRRTILDVIEHQGSFLDCIRPHTQRYVRIWVSWYSSWCIVAVGEWGTPFVMAVPENVVQAHLTSQLFNVRSLLGANYRPKVSSNAKQVNAFLVDRVASPEHEKSVYAAYMPRHLCR